MNSNGQGSVLAPFFREWFVHDIDDLSDPQYFGNVSIDGNWYIIRLSTANTIRYALPQNNDNVSYQEAWTNRATLNYGYIFE